MARDIPQDRGAPLQDFGMGRAVLVGGTIKRRQGRDESRRIAFEPSQERLGGGTQFIGALVVRRQDEERSAKFPGQARQYQGLRGPRQTGNKQFSPAFGYGRAGSAKGRVGKDDFERRLSLRHQVNNFGASAVPTYLG